MARARRSKRPQSRGPYLDAALICEQVIREKDGAFSAIRLVNRLTIHDVAPAPGTAIMSPLMLLVSFKSGEFSGSQELSIYVEDTSHVRHELYQRTALAFESGDTGQAMAAPLMLPYDKDGTYWVEIVLDGKRFSRIPLTLVHDKQPSQRE